MSTLIICPSRNRPENVKRLLDACVETEVSSDICIAIESDLHDVYREYVNIYSEYFPILQRQGSKLILSTHPVRRRIGPTLNNLAPYYAKRYGYDVIGFIGDDHLPRTLHWDKELSNLVNHKESFVAWGNDLLQGINLPTFVFMSSKLITPVDQFCPPGQDHLYLDNYWRELGHELGFSYSDEVVVEHLHPDIGKADSDEGYAEVNELYGPDGEKWREYLDSGKFKEDVEKIRAFINGN